MHYVIMKWNQDDLKWIIVHYSHSLEDMENMMKQFPEPEYVHLIDLKWIKQYEVMMQIKNAREKFQKQHEELVKKKLEVLQG